MSEEIYEFEVVLHFLIEAKSEREAMEEFKEIYGSKIVEESDDIEICGGP